MNGVGKLSLGQALFNSLKSVHTWMVPYFLYIRPRLDTHSVKGTGYINPTLSKFSTSSLMAGALQGFIVHKRCRTGLASGYVLISC